MAVDTDPARVVRAIKKARLKNQVRKSQLPAAVAQWQQEMNGYRVNAALPRDPMEFLAGTFTPLTPIEPVGINIADTDDEDGRPAPRQREMPPGWNMPVGVPGSEGFKLASFGTLRTYADVYSVARSCIQLRKNEVRGLEWDIMPTPEAEKRMRGDRKAHRDFAERKAIVIKFFRKPDPDYTAFGSYIDASMEEMLVTDALSLFLHPTRKKGGGPFGKGLAALELISGSTIRPLVNARGGRVTPPNPGYQQYLYGVPRVDLMEILAGTDLEEIGRPARQYRGDQLMYLPYTQRTWTPYGFPPLERTLIPTITGLRKQQYQLDYFDEGTLPGAYVSPGEQLGWTPNQLQIWQDQQNALAGDPAYKHKMIAMPPGSKVFPLRPVPLADQFDEIVMTQVCMGYDVEPMELGISPRVSMTQSVGAANQMAKASQDKQERKSQKPTLAFFTDIYNIIIQVVWQQDDMRFVFEGLEEDEDENQLVERLVEMIQYGLASIDECRIALGKPPWGLPITSDPLFVTQTSGMVPLGSIDPTTGKPMGIAPPAPVGGGLPPLPPGQGGTSGAATPGSATGGKPALPSGKPADGTAPGGPGGVTAPPGTPSSATGKPPAASGDRAGTSAPGAPPGSPEATGEPQNPRDAIAPDDKVGQALRDAQEAHAQVAADLRDDFSHGKPMEPPVRPPISDATESPEIKQGRTKAMLSELNALCRHVCKGRDPETWEARHLPEPVLNYYIALCKSFNPNDAAAIAHEFIVACFGAPTLQAELSDVRAGVKTFDVSVPLDATDGKQGLAPMPPPGTAIRHPDWCKGCPECEDNGATSDGYPNGATKAAGGLPKATGPRTRAFLAKVGPEGYIHGWIKVGVPADDGDARMSDLIEAHPIENNKSLASARLSSEMKSSTQDILDAFEVNTARKRRISEALADPDLFVMPADDYGYAAVPMATAEYKGLSGGEKRQIGKYVPFTDEAMRQRLLHRELIRWGETSSGSGEAMAMQEAAIREFGIKDPADIRLHALSGRLEDDDEWNRKIRSEASDELARAEPVFRDFLRAQYNLTQADLKAQGIDRVDLHRGIAWKTAREAPDWSASGDHEAPAQRPMSSWSTDRTEAEMFAKGATLAGGAGKLRAGRSAILSASVPASQILSYPGSGMGGGSVHEVVVLHSPGGQVRTERVR